MKKIYIKPTQAVIKVKAQTMLASSPTIYNEVGNGNQLVNEENSDLNSFWEMEW